MGGSRRPVVVGIGGGSGAGKSTVAAMVADRLRPLEVEIINQDRFFKPPEAMPTYHSTLHRAERPDFNHPDSLRITAMLAACRQAMEPAATDADVLIIEGILVLHYEQLRALMDLRCYVVASLEEMLHRRTERNLAAGYGGNRTEIEHYNAECVTPQHRRFNAPTEAHADISIPNGSDRSAARDDAIDRVCAAINRLRAGPV